MYFYIGLQNLKNLKEINCQGSLLSKKDLYILIKNNESMKFTYDNSDTLIFTFVLLYKKKTFC